MLKEAAFQEIKTEVVSKVGAASRAEDAATGLVQGNPVAAAIAERKQFLVSPRASNASPTVSLLITRSRFTTRLKISVEEGNELANRDLISEQMIEADTGRSRVSS